MWTCFLRQADNLETMMGGDTQHTILRWIKLRPTRLEKQKCCVEQHLFLAKIIITGLKAVQVRSRSVGSVEARDKAKA